MQMFIARCDVTFSSYWLFVLLRVDEQVTEEPKAPQVEDSEQELAEGKLCPRSHYLTYNSVNHHGTVRLS
jgi:hypothetical protein